MDQGRKYLLEERLKKIINFRVASHVQIPALSPRMESDPGTCCEYVVQVTCAWAVNPMFLIHTVFASWAHMDEQPMLAWQWMVQPVVVSEAQMIEK